MPFGMGVWELLLIFAVLLLVFGAKRLPDLGGALGKGIREFKSSVRDIDSELKRPADTQQRELQRPAAPQPLNAEPRAESSPASTTAENEKVK